MDGLGDLKLCMYVSIYIYICRDIRSRSLPGSVSTSRVGRGDFGEKVGILGQWGVDTWSGILSARNGSCFCFWGSV